tara:strand:+ start:6607 stop:6765 length:159 start_codon:yes stop_codon:yes gene_type:complete
MNNRIYPEEIFIKEMKKIDRRKNLVVRQLLIEKKNKIELNGVLQRMIALSIR